MSQLLAQKRAAHALDRIERIKDPAFGSKYRSYVSSLPAAIICSGLGQAMAQLLAQAQKSKVVTPYRQLYDDVEDWCRTRRIFSGCNSAEDHRYLLKCITRCSREEYLMAQAEAIAYLEWLKKFARATFEKAKEG